MTKYSAPSIEVVTFNPADAPRIGMQWWALTAGQGVYNPGAWFAVPNYTPVDIPEQSSRFIDLTTSGGPCNYVAWKNCNQENIPGAEHWDDTVYPVCDDGRASC